MLSLPPPSFCYWLSLTCNSTLHPISASVITRLFLVCLCLFSSSDKDTNHTGFGSTLILTWLYLQRPYFQIRPQSQLCRARTSAENLGWGHTSAHNRTRVWNPVHLRTQSGVLFPLMPRPSGTALCPSSWLSSWLVCQLARKANGDGQNLLGPFETDFRHNFQVITSYSWNHYIGEDKREQSQSARLWPLRSFREFT